MDSGDSSLSEIIASARRLSAGISEASSATLDAGVTSARGRLSRPPILRRSSSIFSLRRSLFSSRSFAISSPIPSLPAGAIGQAMGITGALGIARPFLGVLTALVGFFFLFFFLGLGAEGAAGAGSGATGAGAGIGSGIGAGAGAGVSSWGISP